MEVVRLEKVEMIYKNPHAESVFALKGISCSFEKGKSYAITGESGAGKSTLLNIIAGLLTPSSGNVYIMGENWTKLSDSTQSKIRGKHIGLVAQDFALIEQISVMDNCLLAWVLAGKGKRQGKSRAEELLSILGMKDFCNTKACYLSGGQRQRVAIARALMNNPDIVLADEPTGALDSLTAMNVVKTLLDMTQKKSTVIMVTHNISYADLCDHHFIICDGVIDI